MKLRVWGCRGSIPTPGPTSVKYGGNTSCYEVILDDGRSIILDGGTGIRVLGEHLVSEADEHPKDILILFNHTHWDHIAGFPFFAPLYNPQNRIRIYGPFNLVNSEASFEKTMHVQFHEQFFPQKLTHIPTNIEYYEMKEGHTEIDGVKITSWFMNHPVQALGYKLEHGGKSIFYTGDTEPYQNPWGSTQGADEEDVDEDELEMRLNAELIIKERNNQVVETVRGVDFLLCDAQYTEEEYKTKIGWGHTSVPDALELGIKAGVKTIGLTHHEPLNSDDKLDGIYKWALDYVKEKGVDMHVEMVREGMTYEL
ncbi:MAG: MBL fold metallo-hydrolase [Planctomycetes bacterium]|nr:MBL fold metallo-hydrolase [Planctomycetota bacterium]